MSRPAPAGEGAAARLFSLGDAALTLELGTVIDPAIHARVLAISAALEALRGEGALAGVEDWVASFAALTLYFDPEAADAEALGALLLRLAARGESAEVAGQHWFLPACFDEDFAPDLAALAASKGKSVAEVIGLLTAASFPVYTLGFLPGFAYLGGLPEALQVPRLASPRAALPATSIAVAGAMCAVYPWVSPGGWHLVGRCPVPMFDARHTARPALLAPGDVVHWRAVSRARHDEIAAAAAADTLDLAAFCTSEGAA